MAVRVLGGGSTTEVRVLDGLVPWPDVLGSAAWHVDAGWLTEDGNALLDLSGSERHAVFGADAAAPLVLPWDGDDYVFHNGDINSVTRQQAYTFDPASSTLVMEVDLMVLDDGSGSSFACCDYNAWLIYIIVGTRQVQVDAPFGMTGGLSSDPLEIGRRYVLRAEADLAAGSMSLAIDGTVVATTALTGTFTPTDYIRMAGQGVAGRLQRRRYYRTTFMQDGVVQHEFLPKNAYDDYTKVRDSGAAGGYWWIGRADTGFKTAVVDRPLLVFDLVQHATWQGDLDLAEMTLLMAVRMWPDIQGQSTYFDTSAVTNTDGGRTVLYRASGSSNGCIAWYKDANDVTRSRTSAPTTVLGQGTVIVGMQVYRDQYGAINAGVQSLGPTTDPPPSYVRDALRIGNRFNNTAGMMGEFVAAAVFSRALSEIEIGLASEALAGRPRMEDRRRTAVREIGSEVEVLVRPTGLITVIEVEPPQAPDVGPDETWTREEMRAWLASVGVVIGDDAYENLSHEELWELVEAVLSP